MFGTYLVGGLETSIGDLSNRKLLVVSLLSGDDRSIGSQGEVNSGIGHQVGLELSQIYIQSPVESKRSCDGRHDLTNQSV